MQNKRLRPSSSQLGAPGNRCSPPLMPDRDRQTPRNGQTTNNQNSSTTRHIITIAPRQHRHRICVVIAWSRNENRATGSTAGDPSARHGDRRQVGSDGDHRHASPPNAQASTDLREPAAQDWMASSIRCIRSPPEVLNSSLFSSSLEASKKNTAIATANTL